MTKIVKNNDLTKGTKGRFESSIRSIIDHLDLLESFLVKNREIVVIPQENFKEILATIRNSAKDANISHTNLYLRHSNLQKDYDDLMLGYLNNLLIKEEVLV